MGMENKSIDSKTTRMNYKSNYNSLLHSSKSTKYNINTSIQKYDVKTLSPNKMYDSDYNLDTVDTKQQNEALIDFSNAISAIRFITTGDTDLQTSYNPYKSFSRRATTGLLDKVLMTGINNNYKFITNYENISEDGYTVQGIAEVNGITYFSCHGSGNSRLYIYDKNKYFGFIRLDQSSHVGGITFDEKNNILYVTNGGGKYSTYNMIELSQIINNEPNRLFGNLDITLSPITGISKKEFNEVITRLNDENLINLINEEGIDSLYDDWKENYNDEKYTNINTQLEKTHSLIMENNIEAKCTASTTYFYKDNLYTCQFEGVDSGTLSILKPLYTEKNGKPFITYEKTNEVTLSVPSRVQGIAVTEYEGNEYIVFSRSTGPVYSTITVYKKNDDGSYTNMGDRNYSLGGMEGIYIDENNQITACFEFEKATMTMSMETLLDELQPEEFSIIPYLIQKIGGAFYESGAMDLASTWTSGWSVGYKNIPQNILGNIIYTAGYKSILYLFTEKVLMPSSLKENDVIYDGTELLEKYIHNKYGKPYETLGESIKEDGIFKGGAKGLGRLAVEYEIDKGNLAANAFIYDGEVVASLLNKIPGVDIDMSAFKEAGAYVDKYISYDKAEELTKEYFLEPLANTFQNIISFKKHKNSSDNGVEHSGGHTGSGRHH